MCTRVLMAQQRAMPIALPLGSDAPAPSLPLGQGAGGRSGCGSSLLAGTSNPGVMPGCTPGEASGLPALPDPDPHNLIGSLHGSTCSTPSSSPGVDHRHLPVYADGMAFYPTTGAPDAGQQHGIGSYNDSYLYQQNQTQRAIHPPHPHVRHLENAVGASSARLLLYVYAAAARLQQPAVVTRNDRHQ